MKRFFPCMGLILFIFAACNPYTPTITKEFEKLNISDAKYIFKSSLQTKSSSALEEGFWKMTDQGLMEQLTFLDENGNPVDCVIEEIWQVAENYLGVWCGEPYLIDKRTAKVYTYPANAFGVVGWGFTNCNFNQQINSFEFDNKLYMAGNPYADTTSDFNYYVLIDTQNQTSTRLTPKGLDVLHFTVGNNGLISFTAGYGNFVSTHSNKMIQLGEANYSRIFTDKNHNMFLLSYEGQNTYDTSKLFISRIDFNEESVKETRICEFDASFGPLNDSFYTIVNERNGCVIFCGEGFDSIWEFDGTSVKCVSESGIDWKYVDIKGFDIKEAGWIHNYYMSIPEDNFFISGYTDKNKIWLSHLDLSNYKIEGKEIELFPSAEYTLIGDVEHRDGFISYSCIRFSDSSFVTFRMDYNGNRQLVNENNSSYTVNQLILL